MTIRNIFLPILLFSCQLSMAQLRDRELTMIGHDGLDPGYTSQLSIDSYTGNAVILLRNCRPGITDLVSATREVLSRL
jgi:hypothetical protein